MLPEESNNNSPRPHRRATSFEVDSGSHNNQHNPIHNSNHNCNKDHTAPAGGGPPEATTDVVGTILGDFGVWQLRTVLVLFLCKIPAAWFMACIIFTAPELRPAKEFACDPRDLTGADDSDTVVISPDQCSVEGANGSSLECRHFVYNSPFESLIMQFDLVCGRDILVAWTQYWHLFGVLLGGVAGTKMMLRISPRNVYVIGMLAQIACGCVTGFARDFSLHCAFRCLSAVCCAIMFTSGQAIFSDITAGRYRTGLVILYDTFWSIGVILLPGLSSFFDHWTLIYLGITFPTLVLLLLLLWTPDSPRWLLRHGDQSDLKRVERMLREAAAINERSCRVPPELRLKLEVLRDSLQSQPPAARWTDLWRGHRGARRHMVAAHLALAAFIINFMGMLLNIRSFGRDFLVPNTIAMGFSEIVGCFLALHLALKHDRWKWQWAGGLNVVAGLVGCLGWLFSGSESMDPELKVSLWMVIATLPKACVSLAQSLLLACMGELVPPPKRAPFVFSVVTFARVWLLTAPFINVLKRFDVALSLSSYCALSVLGGLCLCAIRTPQTSCSSPSSQVAAMTASTEPFAKGPSSTSSAVWTVQQDELNTRL